MGSIANVVLPFESIKLVLRRWVLWEGYFISIFLDDGVKGFSRGSTMRLGRLILGGGIVFTVYEKTRFT
jgi:hypothetical protein